VHRDLKPANIFLARNDVGGETVKVLDFGVAKTFGEESLTPMTDIVGSPHYLAPEQLAEKRRLRRETDVWALGVVLYRGITGALPFDAPNLVLLCKAILEGTPKRLRDQRPDCPEELERIVLRCLQKPPEQRFPTLDALATALAPFAEKPQQTSMRNLLAATESTQIMTPASAVRTTFGHPPSTSGRRGSRPDAVPPPEPSRPMPVPSTHDIEPMQRSSKRFVVPLIAFLVASALGAGVVAAVTAISNQRASGAMLRVKSQPDGASVSIDFGPQRSSAQPIGISIDGAPHNVTIGKNGYRPETRNVTFSGDIALDVVLVPLPK
jgi:serine/threonine protein kinase